MKLDLPGLALRWAAAWFLLSLTSLFLYLVGTAQNFLDSTLADGFLLVRWLTWVGFLANWLLLVPGLRKTKQLAASVFLGVAHTGLLGVVVFWGAWIYPGVGGTW